MTTKLSNFSSKNYFALRSRDVYRGKLGLTAMFFKI